MKKLLVLVLTLCLLLALTACGRGGKNEGPTTKDPKDPAFWSGDWYGWWYVYSCTGEYEGLEPNWWDCCAQSKVDRKGKGSIVIWDETMGDSDALADVRFQVTDGVATSTDGWFMEKDLTEGQWVIRPEDYKYDNFLVIDGAYEDDAGSLLYSIYLRPWGQSWADVISDSPGDIPGHYYDWYLPTLEQGDGMPKSMGVKPDSTLFQDLSEAREGEDEGPTVYNDSTEELVSIGSSLVPEDQLKAAVKALNALSPQELAELSYLQLVEDYFGGVEGSISDEYRSEDGTWLQYIWASREHPEYQQVMVTFADPNGEGKYVCNGLNSNGLEDETL